MSVFPGKDPNYGPLKKERNPFGIDLTLIFCTGVPDIMSEFKKK
jgi:hypothetical protein